MKNQDTNPNRFYFDVSEGFSFFYTDSVVKAHHVKKVSNSSIARILKLIENKTFVCEPFSTVIYFRRKYDNGY